MQLCFILNINKKINKKIRKVIKLNRKSLNYLKEAYIQLIKERIKILTLNDKKETLRKEMIT